MSGIKKRSVSLNGHRTSYSIEDEFQAALVEMAAENSTSLAQLIASIDGARSAQVNLSSALRLAVLQYFKATLPSSNAADVSTNL